jgi:stage II sporulation protein D
MRRLLACLTLAFLACVPAAQAAPPVFFVDGHGWGHGIGMPQYGAQGFASREGRTHAWILAHYYRGTTLGPTSVGSVRILLAERRTRLTVASSTAFKVTDARGRTFPLAAGSHALALTMRVKSGGRWRALASPARFKRGSSHLRLGGRAYRGELVVRSSGGRLSAVNQLSLERYLYGVVPDEMPPSWHPEALKAQAVAARSYAVVSRRTSGIFDLYADTRSQVYNGVPAEDPRATAAIDATKRQVVRHDGAVAWTFFHSTSGGQTASIQHVWATTPRPYLVSVADPHDDLSPYHNWGPFRYSAASFRGKLGSSAPRGALLDATAAKNASKRVATVTAKGALGNRQLSGTTFQARFGLRSSWFGIGVLSLRGRGSVVHGKKVTLTGIARNIGGTAWLERRPWGGTWKRVRDVAPGAVSVSVGPTSTTWFRLASRKGKGAGHRLNVATAVSAQVGSARRAIRGGIGPARGGVDVQVQRRVSGVWRNAARATTAGDGSWRVSLNVTAGSYRATAKAGPAHTRGYSAVATVG